MKETFYYHENSYVVAFDRSEKENGYWNERTYDKQGNQLTYKDSNGFSTERIYDENGNQVTYRNSNGFYNECTYDEQGNKLTYKNSDGIFKIKGEEVTEEEYNDFINKQNRPCVGKKVIVDGVEYELK